jgi:predicted ATP-dependent protease
MILKFSDCVGKDGLDKAIDLLRRIEMLRKETKHEDISEVHQLQDGNKREIKTVTEFCGKKFGTQKIEDARAIWVQGYFGKGSDMVIGGEGWRQF